MRTCIIACETIRKELELVYKKNNCSFPVSWLESGLHNVPDNLHVKLQEAIDQHQEYDQILLAMGYCGNSICGIQSKKTYVIVPRVDDCISLLLGSVKRRQELVKGCGTYFLTKGWLEGEKNIYAEYQYTVKRYGENRAKKVLKVMLKNYRRLGVLDTGAYSLEEFLPQTRRIAEDLGLCHEVIDADESYLAQLLTGPWDEKQFLIVNPGHILELKDLMNYY